jgi:hypothetical protein
VKFEEQNADYETGSLIAVNERMVADDTGCVKSGHADEVGSVGIGVVLARASQGRLQEPSVAHPREAAVDGEETLVDRQGVAFLDPEWFFRFHLDSACRVLR